MPSNRPCKYALVTAFLSLVAASFPVYSAGFDCSKASHTDETAVCTNRSLSEKDAQMTTTYNLLRELLLMGARGALQDEQIQWLGKRRQCGANITCLSQVYDNRNRELASEYSKAARLVNTTEP